MHVELTEFLPVLLLNVNAVELDLNVNKYVQGNQFLIALQNGLLLFLLVVLLLHDNVHFY